MTLHAITTRLPRRNKLQPNHQTLGMKGSSPQEGVLQVTPGLKTIDKKNDIACNYCKNRYIRLNNFLQFHFLP